jgi:hypothetical protein
MNLIFLLRSENVKYQLAQYVVITCCHDRADPPIIISGDPQSTDPVLIGTIKTKIDKTATPFEFISHHTDIFPSLNQLTRFHRYRTRWTKDNHLRSRVWHISLCCDIPFSKIRPSIVDRISETNS